MKESWQCIVEGCITKKASNPYCSAHRNRFVRYGSPTPEGDCVDCHKAFIWIGPAWHNLVLCPECFNKRNEREKVTCKIKGCMQIVRTNKDGLCRDHRHIPNDLLVKCYGCRKRFEHEGITYRGNPFCSECIWWINKYGEHIPVTSGMVDNLKLYDLTIVDYIKMLVAQDFTCAIKGCESKFGNVDTRNNGFSRLSVDHDHKCHPKGKGCKECVRGLLCNYCNRLVGMAEENIEILHGIEYYLQNPPSRDTWDW